MRVGLTSALPALPPICQRGYGTHCTPRILVDRPLHTGSVCIISFRRAYGTTIRTLNPAKFTPQDHVISSQSSTLHERSVCAALHVGQSHYHLPKVYLRHTSPPPSPGHSSDPLGGFLYYHQPPRAPPLAGVLRFRLTASNDPATFASGFDLITRRGVPWYIPLPSIASRKTYEPIRRLLTAVDETVTSQVMDIAAKYPSKFTTGHVRATRYLHSFGQTFDLPLQYGHHKFTFVGKEGLTDATLRSMTSYWTTSSSGKHWLSYSLSGESIALSVDI